jgi:hypothetical protein
VIPGGVSKTHPPRRQHRRIVKIRHGYAVLMLPSLA